MMACEFEHTTMKQYTVFFIQLFNQINLINWYYINTTMVIRCEISDMAFTVCFFSFFSYQIFTALHSMQSGLVERKVSVRPSVCLFVCQTRELWQNGRKICPDLYTIQKTL